MAAARFLLLSALLAIAFPRVGWAQSPDSARAGAGRSSLDWIESEIAKLEQAAGDATQGMDAAMKADELAKGPRISRARELLDARLRADSTSARANILNARLGVAAVLCTPVRINYGSEPREAPLPASARELVRGLDRALAVAPSDPELYYWKGVVCAAPIVSATPPSTTRTSLDFDEALVAMKRAIALAPDSLGYRESLANLYLDLGRIEEASEVLRPVQAGQDPVYRLLADWKKVPRPPNAAPSSDARVDAMNQALREGLVDLTTARVDAYVVPSVAKEIESHYAGLFPGFKLYSVEEREGDGTTLRMLVERLLWSGDALAVAANRDDAIRGDDSGTIVVFVLEVTKPSREALARYGLSTGKVFSVVMLFNYHGLERKSPEASATALGLAGAFEASSGGDRATLEFGNDRKVRLSVFWAGASPQVYDGEYTVESGEIAIQLEGAPVLEPEGKRGLLHVSAKGETLVALINRDKTSGQRFEFTKK